MQQSQAKDFADRAKYLTRDTAIGKQRMPENQRENAEEKISIIQRKPVRERTSYE